MPADHAEVLARWTGSFVQELVACGLRNVCLCPGSRSTPLAVAFARHPRVKIWTHLDERSCAYFALGMARARPEEPVAILCSSGTAAVNFAPAVVEAFHSRAPLVVLTADRPPELQELSANQTIDQHGLYGSAAKWFCRLPLPEASEEMLRYVRMVADRAVSTAQQPPRGPVHLNLPFREPLMPARFEFAENPLALTAWKDTPADALPGALDGLEGVRRPLIVCGPGTDATPGTLLTLAQALGAPLLADPVSGLRGALPSSPNAISAYDAFLRSPALCEYLRPDFVLRLGDPPTSKALATYLQHYRDVRQVAVAPAGKWPDPDLTASEMVHAGEEALCRATAGRLQGRSAAEEGWLQAWQDAEQRTREAVGSVVDRDGHATEVSAVLDLASELPAGATVIPGNSMPVRDADTFFACCDRAVRVLGNRGASGIDGVVSTALGVSALADGPTVLLIGDLSFYHDMNGLLAAGRHGLSATIVLVNNDGGGIFSFLPQRQQSEDFEELFGTPHGLDFSHVAGLYGVEFQRAGTRREYRRAVQASMSAPGVQVIEVRTDRDENLELHGRIWAAVADAVDSIAHPTVNGLPPAGGKGPPSS